MKSLSYPPWLDLWLWQRYREHRVKIKKPMTEYAEQLNINKLELIMQVRGLSQQKIINNVIERGWQGIFPPTDSKPDPPNQPYVADMPADTDGTEKYRDISKLANKIKEIP